MLAEATVNKPAKGKVSHRCNRPKNALDANRNTNKKLNGANAYDVLQKCSVGRYRQAPQVAPDLHQVTKRTKGQKKAGTLNVRTLYQLEQLENTKKEI